MKKLYAIALLFLAGCTEPGDIPFEVNESRLVVEGWFTNIEERQYVRVSRTVPFTTSQQNEIISEATVRVEEYNGNQLSREFDYIYANNGYYYSDTIQGITGRSYVLTVILPNGQTVRSIKEPMQSINPIDTLGYGFFLRDSDDNPSVEETIYYPIAWTSDPSEEQNFYRWKLYRNDTLFSEPGELFLFNDRFINGNEQYRQEFTSYEYQLLDTIRAERLALSKGAFDFLSQLKSQTTSLGTNTSVSPASVTGNLSFTGSGEATLGYFGAIALTRKEAIITEGE